MKEVIERLCVKSYIKQNIILLCLINCNIYFFVSISIKKGEHQMTKKNLQKSILILLIFAAIIGCKKNLDLVKVEGTVICDGQAVPGQGTITFLPVMDSDFEMVRQGTARFSRDGQFSASTYTQGDGLLPGRYNVKIECWETAPSFNGSKGVSLIERKYLESGTTSGISVLEIISGQPQKNIIFKVVPADEKTIETERKAHQSVEAHAQKLLQ
jgi:hypothetical protein